MISVIEKYRDVQIIRGSSPAMNTNAAAGQAPVHFHAMPNGIKVVAQSIEAVRAEIDKVLDAPPDPAG